MNNSLGKFKFQDCLSNAGNEVETALGCVTSHMQAISDDNKKMTQLFKRDFPQYFWRTNELLYLITTSPNIVNIIN